MLCGSCVTTSVRAGAFSLHAPESHEQVQEYAPLVLAISSYKLYLGCVEALGRLHPEAMFATLTYLDIVLSEPPRRDDQAAMLS